MARVARIVVPGYPHHVTQRGNRKQTTFFSDNDYRAYLELLHENQVKAGAEIWAYCLMPNHVHLVVVPQQPDSLAKMLRVTHHRYALRVNSRNGWRGHLWQERFYSFVMDERHLTAAVRYVELNPVRAGLCERADEWPWSSVHVYLHGKADPIVNPLPMRELVPDWDTYLHEQDECKAVVSDLRRHTASGRPAGNDEFLCTLEAVTGRRLRRLKPGPPRKRQ